MVSQFGSALSQADNVVGIEFVDRIVDCVGDTDGNYVERNESIGQPED